jgi:UDP-N-acetylglucosamine 2-epimerase
MRTLTVMVVAGARPSFMKVPPVMTQMAAHNRSIDGITSWLDVRLVHTGQHYDENMSGRRMFRELGIPRPDINLEVLERLARDVDDYLSGPERRGEVPPLWDGLTAKRTLETMLAASDVALLCPA